MGEFVRSIVLASAGITAAAALDLTGCSSSASSSSKSTGSTSAASQGSSGVAAGTGARLTAQLQPVLLKVEDLGGTGWKVTPADDSDDSGDSSDPCGGDDPFPKANQAEVGFGQDAADVVFSQQLGSAGDEAGAKVIYTKEIETFNKCSGTADSDGFVVTATEASLPKLGDESKGYTLVGHQTPDSASPSDSSDDDTTFDVAIVRDGRLLELYLYGPASDGDTASFVAAVKAGVNRAHALR
jgi:hypothetical protein